MNYLNKGVENSRAGDVYTSEEISRQPLVWQQTYLKLLDGGKELTSFINNVLSIDQLHIVLTGAGSSAYIGEVLQGIFQKNCDILSRAVSTTDIVSHPQLYLQKRIPLLLISFARSGDSPESLAAVELADEICDQVYHLIITCSREGKLAQAKTGDEKSLIFTLPESANDKGLAMTSSFTSMLLAGVLMSRLSELPSLKPQVDILTEYAENVLENYAEKLKKISKMDFDRVVFLGSGSQLGAARESQLKVQELTSGKVLCKHDSFLGFRHGPKVVLTSDTLIVYLFSNKTNPNKYELDLVRQIESNDQFKFSVGVTEWKGEIYNVDLDIILSVANLEALNEDFMPVVIVLPAQVIGYYKSIELTLNPDQPSSNGAISRVVKGVKIYK
ncbi:SIS domain-containing protein [Reichenbachiella sp. MALMAid0571]|uniref:SIS domain-containing protein n=1 Tax=Reichenbachiella sp. MALMAid0571 TaxID=3143939 RepID=UPI0032DEFEDF